MLRERKQLEAFNLYTSYTFPAGGHIVLTLKLAPVGLFFR